MATQKIEVLSVEHKQGIGKKSQSPYSMDICQCILHQADGNRVVGELMLPKDHAVPAPGFYTAEVGLVVSFDKKIQGQVLKLVAVEADRKGGSVIPGELIAPLRKAI